MRIILCSRLGHEIQAWASAAEFAEDISSGTVLFEDHDRITFDVMDDADTAMSWWL
jgi:hypothetical protein